MDLSPITYDDAFAATDPSLNDTDKGPDGLTARGRSAQAIMNGVAANEVYWNHRSELEALKAQATGHGEVIRGEEEEPPTVESGTEEPAIEGSATEEPTTALGTGASETATAVAPPAPAPSPSPDNPNEAIAKLRAQIVAAGGTPEA